MNPVLECILTGLVNGLMCMYMWSKLLDKKYDMKDKKTYLVYILFTVCIVFNFLYMTEFLRVVVITIVFMIMIKITLDKRLNACVITAIMSQIIGLIAEMLFTVFMVLILKRSDILANYSGALITSISLFFLNYFILKIAIFKKINAYLINKTDHLIKFFFIILAILIMLIFNYLLATVYYRINVGILVIVNTLIIILYVIIMFRFLMTQNKYNEISGKYVNTLSSLKEYEDILDKYRVTNHENKNQLLMIRSMIIKKDKNIPNYIDTLIDTTIKDSEKLMFDTNAIPAGGLRAIIYSKMLYMKDNNIQIRLNVNRKVRTIDLLNLDDKLMLDICKIIGVFLDNAIEEVLLLKKKEIEIELYLEDDNLCVAITNNFKEIPELDKIDNKGYTTKDKGHGYGLTLVQNIISESNGYLKNVRRISKNYFTQILIIKVKK